MGLDAASGTSQGTLALGAIDQVPRGQGRCFIVGGRRIAVFRLLDGRVYALDDVCPHRGGPLSDGVVGVDYGSEAEVVLCPLHAHRFSLCDGRGVRSALVVRNYPVEVRGGQIHVAVD